MTPPARAQAAIELLGEIILAAERGGAAADTVAQRFFKARRYAGSGDRRAIRELAYRAIRRAGERPADGRAALAGVAADDAAVAALFDGSARGPAPIAPDEVVAAAGVAPAWLAARLATGLDAAELPALLDRAPLDVRVNRLRGEREALITALPGATPTPHAAGGVRLPADMQVERLPEWDAGAFEVMDEGSQLVAAACGARAGMMVVDLCAGAGGKTLAFGDAMGGEGRLIACDVDRARLSRLPPRAARAGIDAEVRLLDGAREAAGVASLRGAADLVVVDAPCSGTGTWRRNPEARWRLTPERIERLAATQAQLLDLAATLVRPGGTLAYIVCSLLDEEGAGQAAAFLARSSGWRALPVVLSAGRTHGPGWRLTPKHDGTDGFFVARFAAP